MTKIRSARVRRLSLVLGSSVGAICAASAAPAAAQCAPDPTAQDGTTTCLGTDADGLVVTTNGTAVQVGTGATVQGTGSPAVTVDVPYLTNFFSQRSAVINIAGTVDGNGQAGISVLSGDVPPGESDQYGTLAAITVANGGVVTGSTGVVLSSSPGNPFGPARASVDNSGDISGTSGIALLASDTDVHGFTSIINRAGGTIGAIGSAVYTLDNAGTIDGGNLSAIDSGLASPFNPHSEDWTNSGTIRSNGSAATLISSSQRHYAATLTNSGIITNTGSGGALTGAGFEITNVAGGLISTSGGTAIAATDYLSLINAGQVDGNINIIASTYYPNISTIDSTLGVINGHVTFGAGNDVLHALYGGTPSLVTGITGSIDGGAGANRVLVQIGSDRTINTPINLPTRFEQIEFDTVAGATATLGPNFVNPSAQAVVVGGSGTFRNQGTIVADGTALVGSDVYRYPRIINEGVISTLVADPSVFAVGAGGISDFINSGTVNSASNGVGFSGVGIFGNSGLIDAAGTAVSFFGSDFDNSGTIRSTGGTALIMRGSSGYARTNSGLIDGAAVGVNLNTNMVNTGTITSLGTAIYLESYGQIDNRSGGTITGGTAAIGPVSGPFFVRSVSNAGTINGDVLFAGGGDRDLFFALPGGILNGDLTLDASDYLVTQLVNAGTGSFAGVNGVVSDQNSNLVYQVYADTTAQVAMPTGFGTLGYELFNGAALTLTNPGVTVGPLTFAGTGSIDLDADISGTSPLVQETSFIVPGGFGGQPNDLSIVSRGDLSFTASTNAPNTAFSLGSTAFTNLGTITARQVGATVFGGPSTAISGGGTVVNQGTINVGNAVGVSYAASLDNRGSIGQIAGDAPATGISNVATIINSGSIQVAGLAIDNSNIFGMSRVTNAAGGIIASTGGTAIRVYGGSVDNAGTITGTVDLGYAQPFDPSIPVRNFYNNSFINRAGTVVGDVLFGNASDLFLQYGGNSGVTGTIDGGAGIDTAGFVLDRTASVSIVDGQLANFENTVVYVSASDAIATLDASTPLTGDLYVGGSGSIINTASISGAVFTQSPGGFADPLPAFSSLSSFDNRADISGGVSGTIETLINSGSITTDELTGTALILNLSGATTPISATIENSGIIGADAAGNVNPYGYGISLFSLAGAGASATVTNGVGGSIVGGATAVGIGASNVALTIDNAGTLQGGSFGPNMNNRFTGAAIVAGGPATTIINSGTINGQILLGAGDDRVENSGSIDGRVQLGDGNDTFVLRGPGTVTGLIDAGSGSNQFIVDSTGDGRITPGNLINFSGITQIGNGTFYYTGPVGLPTILLESGTLAVDSYLVTGSTKTVTGGNGGVGVRVERSGEIRGGVLLGTGADTVGNSGTILGPVDLGGGDDSYTEGVGSFVDSIDGGAGIDLYRVQLAGDRAGVGARANFEQLAVEGTGTLTLTLDQDYQSVALAGVGFDAALAGFTVGRIDGSAASEQVTLDSDVAAIALGDGEDSLTLATTSAAGFYDGGKGDDSLVFNSAGPLTLSGAIAGFERVTLPGTALFVTGTLGRADDTLRFDSAAQALTIASGGTLAGTVDLGDGDDSFRLASGGLLEGTVIGGAGSDTATIETTTALTVAGGSLVGFEQLVAQGGAPLTLANGALALDSASVDGDLTIASGASLTSAMLSFGPADNTFVVAGMFAGSVNGGAGSDGIAVSGGSATSPIAFNNIASVESLRMSAGLATIAGTAAFGDVALTGGRLIGLAGSTITAPTIVVGPAATFGSAGAVTGNISVAGTLSPGASPGVMTVNGNVSLGATSVTLFEITPAAADKLMVNGTVAIAQGATAQIDASQSLVPGQSLDLVTASGGITGSYTNVIKPASLFGYLVQSTNTITLRGQFLNDPSYSPQVQGAITYLNAVLTSGTASAPLLGAVPQLVNSSGVVDQAALGRITPEAYASATQLTYETGLGLAQVGRSSAFAPTGDEPRAFTFASGLAGTRTLKSGDSGASGATIDNYGMLGGVGWGSSAFSIGAFVGYSKGTQDLDDLGARTSGDGVVAGLHSRWRSGDVRLMATVSYDGGNAKTRRSLPDGSANSHYDLHGWMADISADYGFALGNAWELRPSVGLTAIRVTRDAVSETSTSAYRLDVAGQRDHAVFVDGAISLARGPEAGAALRPYVSLGLRKLVDGRSLNAIGALGGGGFSLEAAGATRAGTLGTLALGIDADMTDRLSAFGVLNGEAGSDERSARVQIGLRLAF